MEKTDEQGTDVSFAYEKIDGGVRITRLSPDMDDPELLIPSFIGEEKVLEIGPYAFCRCKKLKTVVFAEGLERIDRGAFSCCGDLTFVGLPDSLREVGQGAFFGCGSAEICSSRKFDRGMAGRCPVCDEKVFGGEEACPKCGFGSENYDIEVAKRKEYDRMEEMEREKIIADLDRKLAEAREGQWSYVAGLVICLIFTVLMYYFAFYSMYGNSIEFLLAIGLTIADLVLAFGTYSAFGQTDRVRSDIETAENDLALYKEQAEEREKAADEQRKMREAQEAEQRARYKREHPIIVCPVCGSYHTRRISNAERRDSALWWGVGSEYVGKQYICLDCNHKW